MHLSLIKNSISFFFLLIVSQLFLSVLVYAAPDPITRPELTGDNVGAVGQVVAAAMQTKGLQTQSKVLTDLKDFFKSLSTLIFVIVIIAGIISAGLFGHYRKALYYFVGPALFLWMVETTVPADKVNVRFGQREIKEAYQKEIFKVLDGDNQDQDAQPQVSWFYARFDKLVSSITQGIVGVLLDTKNKEDLMRAAIDSLYSRMFMSRSTDPGFNRLLNEGLDGQCYKVTERALAIANANKNRDKVAANEKAELDKAMKNAVIVLSNASWTYLQNLKQGSDADYKQIEDVGAKGQPITCKKLWTYIAKLSEIKGKKIWDKETAPDPVVKSEIDHAELTRKLSEIIKTNTTGDSVDPWKLVGVYYLKNSMAETAHGGMMSSVFSRTPFSADRFRFIKNNMEVAEAQGGFTNAMIFSKTVPYFQGIILYILTATFPFFCFFLLMPGRISSFFVWMTMWVWVKSWDVGFAAIFVVQQFLFKFMARNVNAASVTPNSDDPASFFTYITQNDPLSPLNSYYTLMSILVFSIPLLTAHFCLGAGGLYDAFKMGIDQNVKRFGAMAQSRTMRALAADPAESDYFLHVGKDETKAGLKRAAELALSNPSSSGVLGVALKGFVSGVMSEEGLKAAGLGGLAKGEEYVKAEIQNAAAKGRYNSFDSRATREMAGRLAAVTGRKSYFQFPGASSQLLEAFKDEQTRHLFNTDLGRNQTTRQSTVDPSKERLEPSEFPTFKAPSGSGGGGAVPSDGDSD